MTVIQGNSRHVEFRFLPAAATAIPLCPYAAWITKICRTMGIPATFEVSYLYLSRMREIRSDSRRKGETCAC